MPDRSKTITFLVSPNGLGHFRRVLSVAEQLLKKAGNLSINICCTIEQFQKKRYWNFQHVLTPNAINWELLQFPASTFWNSTIEDYDAGFHIDWFANLSTFNFIQNADLLVSDNLVGILTCRKDALLMGSFLWCDIFSNMVLSSGQSEIKRIAEWEKGLLKQYQPKMFCLRDMFMPSLKELTIPIPLPWFCETEASGLESNNVQILVTGGNTKVLNKKLGQAVETLAQELDWVIYVDKNLSSQIQPINRPNIKEFSFSTADFQDLSLIIARPGIGILTEVVRFNIPILAIAEPGNREIVHNAERISALGIGVAIQPEALPNIRYHIQYCCTPTNISIYRSNLSRLQVNGHIKVAEQLLLLLHTQQPCIRYE